MTGHGAATAQDDQVEVLAEIRSVNNRFLKITVSGELDANIQARLETMIRERIQRGAVNVRIQTHFLGTASQFRINVDQLKAYRQQLADGSISAPDWSALLTLPGVVQEAVENGQHDEAWPAIQAAISDALDNFVDMRAQEGQAMLADLLENCQLVSDHVEAIKVLSPAVVGNYSKRITERINRMLEEHEISVTTSDLVREIGIFSEKVDTSEELVRLASHIEQFRTIAGGEESNGRKLDFLTQELLRETNTIGSKANDSEIANHVVEVKAIIERIREMIQNVE